VPIALPLHTLPVQAPAPTATAVIVPSATSAAPTAVALVPRSSAPTATAIATVPITHSTDSKRVRMPLTSVCSTSSNSSVVLCGITVLLHPLRRFFARPNSNSPAHPLTPPLTPLTRPQPPPPPPLRPLLHTCNRPSQRAANSIHALWRYTLSLRPAPPPPPPLQQPLPPLHHIKPPLPPPSQQHLRLRRTSHLCCMRLCLQPSAAKAGPHQPLPPDVCTRTVRPAPPSLLRLPPPPPPPLRSGVQRLLRSHLKKTPNSALEGLHRHHHPPRRRLPQSRVSCRRCARARLCCAEK
jgi:hypothetical protein